MASSFVQASYFMHCLLFSFPTCDFPPYIFFLSTIQRHQKYSNAGCGFPLLVCKKLRCFNSANGFTNFLFTNSLLSLLIVVRFRTKTSRFCEFVKSCHRRCYFLPFHSIFFPIFPKIEEWKEIAILKLLFPSTFISILEIAIPFHFDCYFLPFYRIAIPFHFLLKWI